MEKPYGRRFRIYAAGMLFLLPFLCPELMASPPVSEMAFRNTNAISYSRIRILWNRYRLGFLDYRKEGIQQGLYITLDTPLVLAGRVKKHGILRETANPLSYSVNSTVYKERGTLVPNWDLSGAEAGGAAVRLLNANREGAEFFYLAEKSDDHLLGAVFSAGKGTPFVLDVFGFYVMARYTLQERYDWWISKNPEGMGEKFLRYGIRISGGGSGWSYNIMPVFTRDRYYRTGAVIRLLIDGKHGPFQYSFLCGTGDPYYLTAPGKTLDWNFLIASSGRYRIGKNVLVSAEGEYHMKHVPVYPDSFSQSGGILKSGVSITDKMNGIPFRITGSSALRFTYDNAGLLSGRTDFESGILAGDRNFKFGVEGGKKMEENSGNTITRWLKGSASWGAGRHRFDISLGGIRETSADRYRLQAVENKPVYLQLRGRWELNLPEGHFYCFLESDNGKPFMKSIQAGIGWRVSAPFSVPFAH